jgi:hypothetical protein
MISLLFGSLSRKLCIRIPKRGEGCLAETNPFCFDRGKKDMVSFYKGLMEKEPSVSIIYKELPRNKFHG